MDSCIVKMKVIQKYTCYTKAHIKIIFTTIKLPGKGLKLPTLLSKYLRKKILLVRGARVFVQGITDILKNVAKSFKN
jgi:hypothetical protein